LCISSLLLYQYKSFAASVTRLDHKSNSLVVCSMSLKFFVITQFFSHIELHRLETHNDHVELLIIHLYFHVSVTFLGSNNLGIICFHFFKFSIYKVKSS